MLQKASFAYGIASKATQGGKIAMTGGYAAVTVDSDSDRKNPLPSTVTVTIVGYARGQNRNDGRLHKGGAMTKSRNSINVELHIFMSRVLRFILLASFMAMPSFLLAGQDSIDGERKLHFYRTGDENLCVTAHGKALRSINSAGGTAIRVIYDDSGRAIRREVWSSSKKTKIREEIYSYNGTGKSALCVITDGDKQSGHWIIIEKFLDEAGREKEERRWEVTAHGKQKEEKHLLKAVIKKYDNDNSNASEITTITKGKDGKKYEVREVFDGSNKYRYENGILRMSKVYGNSNGKEGAAGTGACDGNYTVTAILGEGKDTIKIIAEYFDHRKTLSRIVK